MNFARLRTDGTLLQKERAGNPHSPNFYTTPSMVSQVFIKSKPFSAKVRILSKFSIPKNGNTLDTQQTRGPYWRY
jgi:hypothetical protein